MTNARSTQNTHLGRRGFLTATALGGATIVGATALGGVDAEAAFADTPSLDPGISTSEFAEGTISAIRGNVLHVAGSDGRSHRIQLTGATSIWKLRHTDASAIEVADGLYARGVPMPDGHLAADAVWINIVNLLCTIRGIGRDRIDLAHGHHAVHGRVVRGTTVASYAGRAATGDLSRLRIDQHVQVLGAWRPSDDSIDIAKLTTGK